jgi:ferredoxin-type protein NapH
MKRTKARKIVQLSSVGMIVLIPLLNKHGISVVTGTLYSLAVGPVWITDPVIAVQTVLTTFAVDRTLLLSVVIPVVLALVLGRVFCSWVCPQNAISELFDLIAGKTGIRRLFRPKLSPFPRYAVLALVLVATRAFGLPVVSLLSAPGIISVQTAKFLYEGAVGMELVLIGVIVVFELVVVRRVWCNHLCPVGGFLGILRTRKTMKVLFAEDSARTCGRCGACTDVCRLGLAPLSGNIYPFCHNCGDCVAACEGIKGMANPLRFTF